MHYVAFAVAIFLLCQFGGHQLLGQDEQSRAAVRRGEIAQGQERVSKDDGELRQWLENMVWHHRFSLDEITAVTALSKEQIADKLAAFGISEETIPDRPSDHLFVLPYPGGRHPRIGFLEGAIAPQRETKLSVFCPWDRSSYVVLDIPEAIWSNLGLTYLAHTHIDTIWSKQAVELDQLEWERVGSGYQLIRRLPNGIEFGVRVMPRADHLDMNMWLRNGTDRMLSDLRVQNCVMLKGAAGFDQQSNNNKILRDEYAVCHSNDRKRWIITAWDPLHRNWGNERCPCLHSDPKFPDCEPGQTQWLRGWFSFFDGQDIDRELTRIEASGWRNRDPEANWIHR